MNFLYLYFQPPTLQNLLISIGVATSVTTAILIILWLKRRSSIYASNRGTEMNKIARNNLRLIKLLDAPIIVTIKRKPLLINRRKKKYSFRYFWEFVTLEKSKVDCLEDKHD